MFKWLKKLFARSEYDSSYNPLAEDEHFCRPIPVPDKEPEEWPEPQTAEETYEQTIQRAFMSGKTMIGNYKDGKWVVEEVEGE